MILDVTMPGMSSPEHFHELRRRNLEIPGVFLTARKDEAVRWRLLGEEAGECLFKPFSDTALLQPRPTEATCGGSAGHAPYLHHRLT